MWLCVKVAEHLHDLHVFADREGASQHNLKEHRQSTLCWIATNVLVTVVPEIGITRSELRTLHKTQLVFGICDHTQLDTCFNAL